MKTSSERQVFITGFGGQGIVMAGDILGKGPRRSTTTSTPP